MKLQELANLPHGEANKRLKELGHWDELAGMPWRNYEVSLRNDRDEIVARDEVEAINIYNEDFGLMYASYKVKEV